MLAWTLVVQIHWTTVNHVEPCLCCMCFWGVIQEGGLGEVVPLNCSLLPVSCRSKSVYIVHTLHETCNVKFSLNGPNMPKTSIFCEPQWTLLFIAKVFLFVCRVVEENVASKKKKRKKQTWLYNVSTQQKCHWSVFFPQTQKSLLPFLLLIQPNLYNNIHCIITLFNNSSC